jgi:hypothetical protein
VLTFDSLAALAEIAPEYRRLREARPEISARDVHRYLRGCSDFQSIDQFLCAHSFVYTGTAYGGDDASYRGEGRCYCSKCGLDGDA